MAPFWLMEMRNSSATIIQKMRERTPSLTEVPVAGVITEWAARERSRTRQPHGRPITRTPAPKMAKEARQPTA
jgi:hypothetical protein